MDEVDITAEREEHLYRSNLLSTKRPVGPVANGACHYCGEPVGEGLRWCNAECHADYEREQSLKSRGR